MRLRRSPFPFWVLALALAVLTAVTVARLVGTAADRAARLGGLVDVPVVARDVDAGARLRPRDVTRRRLPADAIPRGPVAGSAVGQVTVVPLVAGEVVLASKLAPLGLRGVAARVPPGQRALAVPVDHGGLALRPGNRVDVLATFDVAPDQVGPLAPPPDAAATAGPPTFPVASAALVVDVGADTVTVAVTAAEAPRVAFALARGTVTLALASP